jgi:pyruvate dehydrogenase E1 component alpha subunit
MPTSVVYQGEVRYLQILDESGRVDPDLAERILPDSDIQRLYEQMILFREFDETGFKLQRSGRMGTFPPNKGSEAVSLGAAQALRKGVDYLVPYYRDNAAMFLHGLPMHLALLHWMGDERGNAIPRRLAMNPISVAIGAQCLHAVGIAWAMKLRKEDRVVLCFLGDGATSTGDFHEAMNFAGVLKTPVIFLCVNNQWAISVPASKQTASQTFAQKALAYGMPTIQVDGNDLLAVNRATREAVERARSGEGPSFIEAVTYRLGDHTTADDARRYRPQEQLDAAMARDPLIRTRKYLESKGLWDEEKQVRAIERAKAIAHEVAEAAMNIEKPKAEDLFRDTFAELPPDLLKQMQTMRTDSLGEDPSQIGLQSRQSGAPDRESSRLISSPGTSGED